MSVARRTGFGFLGVVFGALLGGGAGLLGGLGYTELAGTTSFEGYSGYVVVFWMLAGGILGLIAGAIIGIRLGR